MPTGKVGAAYVANLADADKIVQRAERFFDRGECVKCVELKKVDVVGAEPFQTPFDGPNQVKTRRSHVVGSRPGVKCRLGRNNNPIAAALDRLAKNLLGGAAGVRVGRVEHRQAGVQADIDKPRRFGDVGLPPRLKEFASAAEGAGAEAEDGNFEAGSAEGSVFHRVYSISIFAKNLPTDFALRVHDSTPVEHPHRREMPAPIGKSNIHLG